MEISTKQQHHEKVPIIIGSSIITTSKFQQAIMRRLIMLFATIVVAINAYSQCPSEDRYVLYPTKNIWTFLKLDTSNGKIWQVQYSVEGADYRFETSLNSTALVLDEDRPSGRFKLYPTDNTYNFILIDTKIGTTYQVQWSQEYKNRLVLPISSDGQLIWSCGFAKVKYYSAWRYYDENKQYLTADSFDSCENFNNGLAKVQKDGKSNYIDTTGNYLFKQWYDNCQKYNDQNLAWVRDNGKENYLNIDQNAIFSEWYDKCSSMDKNHFKICSDGKYNILSREGSILLAEWYDSVEYLDRNGFVTVEKDGKYNFVNIKTGSLISEWYDYCYSFIDGYSKVEKDDKYNYIGLDGELIFENWYDYCFSICHGFAAVSNEDNKYNFVDISTGLAISQEWFNDCKPFNSDGVGEVQIEDKWYTIDKTGTIKEK